MNRVVQFIRDQRAAFAPEPDADLLARFARTRDEAAFARLVARHGGVVAGALKRMLPDPADRDDAFQAVFVVLARKAGSLDAGRPLAPWLHKVAVWTARSARRANARRARRHGRLTADIPAPAADTLAVDLDEALAALPEKYRVPVVLCYLEGRPHAEVAARLGYSERTLSDRINRALAKLRARLGDAAPALLLSLASGAVTADAASATAHAVAAGGLSIAVLTLSHEVLLMLWLPKLVTLALGSAGTVAVAGVAVVALAGPPATPPTAKAPSAPPAQADAQKPERLAVTFPELAEDERLGKLREELGAEKRRLAVRRARAKAAVVELAKKAYERVDKDTNAWQFNGESFAETRLVSLEDAEDQPAVKVYVLPAGQPRPNPAAEGNPRDSYQKTEVVYVDRQDLAAALKKAGVKRVWLERDVSFFPEQQAEFLAGCKLAGVTELYCTDPVLLPPETGNEDNERRFATPELIDKLAAKPLGQGPYPYFVRLDLSKLDAAPAAAKGPAPQAAEPKVDPGYAELVRAKAALDGLLRDEKRVRERLERVGSLRARLIESLPRRQEAELNRLGDEGTCVLRWRQLPPPPGVVGEAEVLYAVPVAVFFEGVNRPKETLPFYNRHDLAAELKRAGVSRLVVAHKGYRGADGPPKAPEPPAIGSIEPPPRRFTSDDLAEILAAAKLAGVARVYLPTPTPGNDPDAAARELLAKFGVPRAADAPPSEPALFVRLDLAKYEPPAAAKP